MNDDQTAASLFAQRLKPPAHVVNFGVPGWGATHQVRALETGLFDKAIVGKVAAVIVWVTPPHLERVTGDASWLANAPRYDTGADGKLHYSGTFNEYRWTHPWAGLGYLARTHFRFVRRLTTAEMDREQARLYVALTKRLKELVEERYHAPLVLLSNGPEPAPPGFSDQPDLQYLPAFDGLRVDRRAGHLGAQADRRAVDLGSVLHPARRPSDAAAERHRRRRAREVCHRASDPMTALAPMRTLNRPKPTVVVERRPTACSSFPPAASCRKTGR